MVEQHYLDVWHFLGREEELNFYLSRKGKQIIGKSRHERRCGKWTNKGIDQSSVSTFTFNANNQDKLPRSTLKRDRKNKARYLAAYFLGTITIHTHFVKSTINRIWVKFSYSSEPKFLKKVVTHVCPGI